MDALAAAWAWSEVEAALVDAGINSHALTLPGLDGDPTTGLGMRDHVDTVVAAVRNLDGEVVLVGHSGGGPVVQCVVDRIPDRIKRVIYVDTGPLVAGVALRPDATEDIDLPSWDELAEQQASIEGLDEAALERFRRLAVPQPAGVAASPIDVTDDRRFDVPATVVCTSLPSAVLLQMIEQGQMPSELPQILDVAYIDLPTGHWPMFSRPDDLAEIIAGEARR